METQVKSTWRPSPPAAAREDCTLCRGTGWQLIAAFGSSHARRCSCQALHRVVRLRENVCVPPRYEHCTLDNYHPFNLSQAQALAEARRTVERFPKAGKGVFFVGGAGVGKTHLAVGILLKLMQRLHDDSLFLDFRNPFPAPAGDGREADKRRLSKLTACSVLVIDDIRFQHPGDFADLLACEILPTRARQGRLTIITGGRPDRAGEVEDSRSRGGDPELLLELLGHFRLVPMRGDVNQSGRSDGSFLFEGEVSASAAGSRTLCWSRSRAPGAFPAARACS